VEIQHIDNKPYASDISGVTAGKLVLHPRLAAGMTPIQVFVPSSVPIAAGTALRNSDEATDGMSDVLRFISKYGIGTYSHPKRPIRLGGPPSLLIDAFRVFRLTGGGGGGG
jgi:hypothetical protein